MDTQNAKSPALVELMTGITHIRYVVHLTALIREISDAVQRSDA